MHRLLTTTLMTVGSIAILAASPAAAAQSTSTPPVAAPQVTAEQTASPELVGTMTKELGVTPKQAEGGTGALLGLAKTRLKPEEFAKVSAAVPGTDSLLKAAPAVGGGKAGGMMGMGGAGGAMGLASLAGSFNQLGLKPEMAAKMAPVLINFVKGKGAADAASLLGGVLK